MPIFGCVADDFTGASDAASFLVKGGMSVQLFNGIPGKGSRVGEGQRFCNIYERKIKQEGCDSNWHEIC